jgi:hypothetical protein
MARDAEKVAWTAIQGGAMSIIEGRRRGRRQRALALAATALVAGALVAPSSANAAEDWFCGGVWLGSTWQCRASTPRVLWRVSAVVAGNQWHRICAGSAYSYYGGNNSDWACDYGSVSRVYNGSVYGVGAARNGATYGYQVAMAIQYW